MAAARPPTGSRVAFEGSTAAWAMATLVTVALMTGLIQVGVMGIRRLVNHGIIFQSRELVWMTPAGYLLIFAAAALPIAVLALPFALARRRAAARRIFGGSLVMLGAFGLLLMVPHLHVAAQLLLALGVAVQLSRTLARRPARSLALAAAGLATLVALATAGSHLWRTATRAEGTQAAAPNAPNVLLIILDTVRGGNVSLYGYTRSTMPALHRWASDGVIFDNAFSPGSWTGPSHASMFTGYTPSRLGISWKTWERSLPDTLPTLAEAFRDSGYATGGFVANLLYTAWDSGLGRGFTEYRDQRISLAQVLASTMLGQTPLFRYLQYSRTPGAVLNAFRNFSLVPPRPLANDPKPAREVSDQFLDWQRGVGDRPFFAFLNYFDAHAPYRTPPRYRGMFGPDSAPLNRYDAAIRYLDDELDRLFRQLDEGGVLDRTIVVVTSDHGEAFGERGSFGHGQSVYTRLVWVPLVLRYPRVVPAGVRVDAPVSLRDVSATLLELAGIPNEKFPGRSWSWTWNARGNPDPVISETTATPDTVTNGRITRSAVIANLHLIRWFNGEEELYDYRADRREMNPLRIDTMDAAVVAALRAALRDPLPR